MGSRGVAGFSAAALRRLRTAARLSQDELATRARSHGASVAGPHICLYEQGKRKPQLTTVLALAAVLCVPLSALIPDSAPVDLARLRMLAGMSQGDVARRLGVAQARWSRIERGKSSLDDSMLPPAARLLKIPVGQLRRALEAARSGFTPSSHG
ncbi:helix-turn-helix domain-containing protein [Streptomyces sp. 5.8]|uniref:helix-turn-helix domain-containing protein n=1 Tax=Streptomyces sp. 5.8 TaxID=3406571 RepID=UPI003BB532FB